MKKTYIALEKEYHATLKKVAAFFGITQKRFDPQGLSYGLEKESVKKLGPSRVWIISGISGSGKTTVSKFLDDAGFRKLPNVTTRARRFGEKDSDYVFTDMRTFTKLRKKNTLFHPHKRNAVWHAILKKDIQKLQSGKFCMYMDKSIASSLVLLKAFSKPIRITFVYLLAPSFRDLYKRIYSREVATREAGKKALNKVEIFNRFEEEIRDMEKSTQLPYAYLVNDSPKRVKKIIRKFVENS